MKELWYYTSEGKQMDPVSMNELARLVSDGTLKPTDMVWKEGMPRWIRAASVKELYPDPIASLEHHFTHTKDTASAPAAEKQSGTGAIKPVNGAANQGSAETTQPAPAEDEPRQRGRRRRSEEAGDDGAGGGSRIGIYIVLAFGALVLLGALAVGLVILIVMTRRAGVAQPAVPIAGDPVKRVPQKIDPSKFLKGVVSYKVQLGPEGQNDRTFALRKGVAYTFSVITQPRFPNANFPDVDLHIYHRDGHEETKDDSHGPDSHVRWSPDEDGEYRVSVKNLANINVTSAVTIQEDKPPKEEPKSEPVENLPAGTKTGQQAMKLDPLGPGEEHVFKLRVKAEYRASVKAIVFNKVKGDIDVHLHILKDADGAEVVSDIRPNRSPMVNFTLPATQVVRVRVHNASKTETAKCTVSYDGG